MKKRMYIFTALLFCISMLKAGNADFRINKSEAAGYAAYFLKERLMQYDEGAAARLRVVDIKTIGDAAEPLMYAVNFDRGFVVLSAAKNVWPVVAYAFEGSFTYPEKEQNVAAWLQQYERQLAHAAQTGAAPTPAIREAWQLFDQSRQPQPFRDVEPMLTSKWDQGKYYNGMCPADPAGPAGHCYTGCVATAMGQLMYYFRFPQNGTGSYSYTLPDYGTLSADFGNTTYRWNEMVNQLSAVNDATAELLFHLGVAVDMVYGPTGSGMYNHKAAYALRTYFNYSPETQYVFRDSTSMDWDSLLMTHLDRHIPMYYAGWSVPNINGHAFIVDGYQGEHFYHFNWGWSGSYDGYFYTDELTPGGSNFNLAQELIINCFPDTVNHTYPGYCQGAHTLTSLAGTFGDGSGPNYPYLSMSDCSFLIDPQTAIDSVTSITLSFQRFNLGTGDEVTVYDGADASAPLLGTFTGNVLPPGVISTGNRMFVRFQSDDADTAAGFFASYRAQQPQWCSGLTTFTEPTGTLSDGSGSFYYYNSNICMWYLQPDNGGEITLHFDAFDTEAEKDILRVFDPTTTNLLAEYSGYYPPDSLPTPVTSINGELYVTFTTNGEIRADGWSGWYDAASTGITGKGQPQSFTISPNPAGEMICIRSLNGKAPERIQIFNSLGMQVTGLRCSGHATNPVIINTNGLKPGMYFVHICSGSNYCMQKLIVR